MWFAACLRDAATQRGGWSGWFGRARKAVLRPKRASAAQGDAKKVGARETLKGFQRPRQHLNLALVHVLFPDRSQSRCACSASRASLLAPHHIHPRTPAPIPRPRLARCVAPSDPWSRILIQLLQPATAHRPPVLADHHRRRPCAASPTFLLLLQLRSRA